MKKFIKNIQSKPEHERKRLTIILSCISALIVVAIGILNIKHTIQKSDIPQNSAEQKNAPSPFEIIKDIGDTASSDFSNLIQTIK